jgi:NAD(P)-dependent dehydrogenase (short-subunit alcohol dehydrogenase family)
LAVAGAGVVVAGRRPEPLAATAEELRAMGVPAEGVRADVSVFDDCLRIAEAAAKLGGAHTVVCNAGIYKMKPAAEMSASEWDEVIATNLTGAFHTVRALLPQMLEAGRGGSIVMISSIHGLTGEAKLAAHCAAKFGLVGLAQSLAKELRPHDIAVNAICPGAIAKAGQAPASSPELHALAAPGAIARLAVFLSTQSPVVITGDAIPVYGGTDTKIIVHSYEKK